MSRRGTVMRPGKMIYVLGASKSTGHSVATEDEAVKLVLDNIKQEVDEIIYKENRRIWERNEIDLDKQMDILARWFETFCRGFVTITVLYKNGIIPMDLLGEFDVVQDKGSGKIDSIELYLRFGKPSEYPMYNRIISMERYQREMALPMGEQECREMHSLSNNIEIFTIREGAKDYHYECYDGDLDE